MVNTNLPYQQQIAQWRMERAQRETTERLNEIRNSYAESQRSRDEALRSGDRESAEMFDNDCVALEQDWLNICPRQQPEANPQLVEFFRRRAPFIERHGQAAIAAMDLAHGYATRPRNPNARNPANAGMGLRPNTPEYFKAMDDLLTMYAKDYGLRYDPEETLLTPNEAVKISGVSPRTYNNSLRELVSKGRIGDQK